MIPVYSFVTGSTKKFSTVSTSNLTGLPWKSSFSYLTSFSAVDTLSHTKYPYPINLLSYLVRITLRIPLPTLDL